MLYWIKGSLKWKALCNKNICQIGFSLFFLWLRASSPFHIWLIAKCEISEGHACLWLLLVRSTEQNPLHVAPVIIKHLSLTKSWQKAIQRDFIQVHGRNSGQSADHFLSNGPNAHWSYTADFSHCEVWCKADAPLSCYLWFSVANFSFSLHISTTSLGLIFWNVKISKALHLSDAPGTVVSWPFRKPRLLGNLTWLVPPSQSDPQRVLAAWCGQQCAVAAAEKTSQGEPEPWARHKRSK